MWLSRTAYELLIEELGYMRKQLEEQQGKNDSLVNALAVQARAPIPYRQAETRVKQTDRRVQLSAPRLQEYLEAKAVEEERGKGH